MTGEVIRFVVVVVVDFRFRFLFLALNKSPCDHSHDCFLIFYLKLKKKQIKYVITSDSNVNSSSGVLTLLGNFAADRSQSRVDKCGAKKWPRPP